MFIYFQNSILCEIDQFTEKGNRKIRSQLIHIIGKKELKLRYREQNISSSVHIIPHELI